MKIIFDNLEAQPNKSNELNTVYAHTLSKHVIVVGMVNKEKERDLTEHRCAKIHIENCTIMATNAFVCDK